MNPRQLSKLLILLFTLVGIQCSSVKTKDGNESKKGYELVWSDEFDYRGLPDPQKWSYETAGNEYGWGNKELQFYTDSRPENARVEDGKLFITAIHEDFEGRKFTSTRLISKGKGDWLYGRIDVRAKLPSGKGTWPAIWMMPTDWQDKGWPGCGEIDIMEHVGYDPGVVHGTIHTEAYNHTINTQKGNTVKIPDAFTNFHVYSLEWEKKQMRWFVDGEKYFEFNNENKSYKEWPFDKHFHLLLNLAVGGYWGGKFGVDDFVFPQSLVVDYVRVYQKRD